MQSPTAQPKLHRRHCLALAACAPLAYSGWPANAAAVTTEEVAAAAPPPSVQLARTWPAQRAPDGYLVSEKFDGVRAVWDGQALRYRSGRTIAAPAWFVAALPALALDGELWMGRRQFDRLSGTVRQAQPDDTAWRTVQYRVFDSPAQPGSFADRMQVLHSTLLQRPVPWLAPVAQEAVPSAAALYAKLQTTVAQGGEGLVLHRADAPWQAGRTDALYKLKPTSDEEGLLVGYVPGKGRLQGLTGALLLEMPSGQRFALGAGLSDALRRNPPPLGAWVTYRLRDHTPAGVPRFASFLRVRAPE